MLIPAFHLEPGSPWRDQGGFLKEAILRKNHFRFVVKLFHKMVKVEEIKSLFQHIGKGLSIQKQI